MKRWSWAIVFASASLLDAHAATFETATRPAPEPRLERAPRELPSPYKIELDVPQHNAAVVSVPKRDGRPRPVLVATHGAWDRPEWHCELWQKIVGARGFVLCPRGRPTIVHLPPDEQLFYYPDHFSLSREVTRAIEALAARFGDDVDVTRPAYTGFSQGAIQGALVLPISPANFARALLVEGGVGEFDEWGLGPALKWEARGGERIFFACGRAHCQSSASRSAGIVRKAHVDAKVLYVPGAGHGYGGGMEQELAASFDAFVAGDPRWAP